MFIHTACVPVDRFLCGFCTIRFFFFFFLCVHISQTEPNGYGNESSLLESDGRFVYIFSIANSRRVLATRKAFRLFLSQMQTRCTIDTTAAAAKLALPPPPPPPPLLLQLYCCRTAVVALLSLFAKFIAAVFKLGQFAA